MQVSMCPQKPVPQSSVSSLVGNSQIWDTEPAQGLVTKADSDWTAKEGPLCRGTTVINKYVLGEMQCKAHLQCN